VTGFFHPLWSLATVFAFLQMTHIACRSSSKVAHHVIMCGKLEFPDLQTAALQCTFFLPCQETLSLVKWTANFVLKLNVIAHINIVCCCRPEFLVLFLIVQSLYVHVQCDEGTLVLNLVNILAYWKVNSCTGKFRTITIGSYRWCRSDPDNFTPLYDQIDRQPEANTVQFRI